MHGGSGFDNVPELTTVFYSGTRRKPALRYGDLAIEREDMARRKKVNCERLTFSS